LIRSEVIKADDVTEVVDGVVVDGEEDGVAGEHVKNETDSVDADDNECIVDDNMTAASMTAPTITITTTTLVTVSSDNGEVESTASAPGIVDVSPDGRSRVAFQNMVSAS
jgi:hypothetical protein